MQGTRIPDVMRDSPAGWERWETAPPGSYMKVLKGDGEAWCWYVRAPDGTVATIGFGNHSVAEHDDGTITVSPSIVMPHGNRWHGWLQRGVWSG
jgi:hypothetical protein